MDTCREEIRARLVSPVYILSRPHLTHHTANCRRLHLCAKEVGLLGIACSGLFRLPLFRR